MLLVVAGLVLLVVGADWLVDAAVAFARALGVSDLVIGLTIVAAGTSLPEVATSVVATIRGERDIAVGNVVGSNIFNILGCLGVSGLVAPGGLVGGAAAARVRPLGDAGGRGRLLPDLRHRPPDRALGGFALPAVLRSPTPCS